MRNPQRVDILGSYGFDDYRTAGGNVPDLDSQPVAKYIFGITAFRQFFQIHCQGPPLFQYRPLYRVFSPASNLTAQAGSGYVRYAF